MIVSSPLALFPTISPKAVAASASQPAVTQHQDAIHNGGYHTQLRQHSLRLLSPPIHCLQRSAAPTDVLSPSSTTPKLLRTKPAPICSYAAANCCKAIMMLCHAASFDSCNCGQLTTKSITESTINPMADAVPISSSSINNRSVTTQAQGPLHPATLGDKRQGSCRQSLSKARGCSCECSPSTRPALPE